MKKEIVTILSSALLLTACADKSEKINASYVSPLQYNDYSCKQIKAEIARVGRKMSDAAGVQDKIASNDAGAMGVGLVLFWPALFFIDNTDNRVEVARLKGEFDALEQAAIQKNCSVAKEIAEARKIEEARIAKLKAEEKAMHRANN